MKAVFILVPVSLVEFLASRALWVVILLAVDSQGFQDLIDLKSDAGFAPSVMRDFTALG